MPLLGRSPGQRRYKSLFLPNEQSMDDWYTAVYALPTVWPDVSMMGINNMREAVGYEFHYMRKKYRVPGMWALFARASV